MDNTQQNDPLVTVAESIVATRPGISDDLKQKMIDELVVAMERFINAELLSYLNEEQAKEFLALLDTNPSDEQTVQFFKDKNIDVDSAVTSALQMFKDAYVGN